MVLRKNVHLEPRPEMSIGGMLVGTAILLVAGLIVIDPLVGKSKRLRWKAKIPAKTVEEQKRQSLVAIQELDFDFQTGKIEQPDYESLRAALLADAAQAFEAADLMGSAPEDELEKMVNDRRRKLKNTRRCDHCGASLRSQNRFCSACGAQVESLCSGCGVAVHRDDKFCSTCGEKAPLIVGVRR
jgi:rRNA maturation endonuclease Nob1